MKARRITAFILALAVLAGCGQPAAPAAPSSSQAAVSEGGAAAPAGQPYAPPGAEAASPSPGGQGASSPSRAPQPSAVSGPPAAPPATEQPGAEIKVSFSAEPAYWHAHTRIPLCLENLGSAPIQLGKNFTLERLEGQSWVMCSPQSGAPAQLDNPGVQFPIEPGEKRVFLAYVGGEAENKNGVGYMPEGRYRLTITLPDGSGASAEFEYQKQLPEYDDGFAAEMELPRYPAGQDKITMLITNNSGHETAFGEEFFIEKLENGQWQAVGRQGEVLIPAIALIAPDGAQTRFTGSLKGHKYDLGAGSYRMVKQIGSWYRAAEFEIA